MAKIFYNPLTSVPETILQFRWSEVDEAMMITPIGSAYIEFDQNTNSSLITAINSNWDSFKVDKNGILYRNGQPIIVNPPSDEWNANADIKSGYPILPEWVKTATATQASQYVTNNVLQGQTKSQINAWIDANITEMSLSQFKAALKLIAGAIVDLRDLMAIEAKLIIYLRDLVLRFKKL